MTVSGSAAPDTVTDAIRFLADLGYREEVRLDAGGLRCDIRDGVYPASSAVVDFTFRFEGESDPGDEMIVLGLRLPDWGVKGYLATGYGLSAPPEEAAVLRALATPRAQP